MSHSTENARRFAEVYDELRQIAKKYYFANPADYTLQPTALVNEAFTKIVRQRNVDPMNRDQFVGVAAQILRNKLIDYQRRKRALKHGGGVVHVELDEALAQVAGLNIDLLALEHAIAKLKDLHFRQAEVVRLKYLEGWTNEEVAERLKVSVATVKTDWTIAQAFLYRALRSRGVADADS